MKNRYFSEPVFTCPLSPVTAICLLKFYLSNIKVSHSIATVSHSITTVSISIATVFHSIANVSLYSIATVSHFNTKVSLTITTVSFLSILSLTTIVSLSIATFSLYVTTVSHSIANVSLSSIATASQSITSLYFYSYSLYFYCNSLYVFLRTFLSVVSLFNYHHQQFLFTERRYNKYHSLAVDSTFGLNQFVIFILNCFAIWVSFKFPDLAKFRHFG